MQVFTVATLGSMPRARALGRSLQRHQPDWAFEVMLVADDDVVTAADRQESLRVRSVFHELDLDIETLLARHDEEDLSTLLVPRLLQRHAERGSGPVLHLPSTVWVLASLQTIELALSSHSVLLVPRMTVDVPDDGLEPTPAQMEAAGRVEEAIIGVDASARAQGFLAWWNSHVERSLGSLDARQTGARPEDRPWLARFLELAPARFSTGVLDDPGCNLNMWNLHRRSLDDTDGGVLVDGHWPLRFLNLPGFEPDRPHRLSPTASRARVSRSEVLHELCERYASELREGGWTDSDHRQDVGRRLAEGLVYDDSLRAIYASALALGERFADLFTEEGTQAFIAWLEGPAPRGSAHGINRYVFHRVARERPDVVRAYPDMDGADGAEYVAWCWSFGREELSIPDRFMPRRAEPTSGIAPQLAPEVATDPADPAPSPNPPTASSDGLAVRLTGYLGHSLGLGAAARGYAQALGAAGVPVRTVTVPLHHLALPVNLDDEYGRHGFQDLIHDGAHGFEIVAVNADELPDFVKGLGEDYFEGPRIGIWGWETNSIPPRWQRAFALIEEIWVYSEFMAANIGAVAPVPVVALPPPVERPTEPVEPLRLGVPPGFLFLFVFDYLSTVQRKNPVGLIDAFKLAFAPGEGPQLLVKTINAPLRPLAEEEVLWAAHGRSDIHIVDRSLSRSELGGLMAGCNCYVSLHRAEGFGLTMAEAMAIGKPVIATGYSGNVDFMNRENSYLVDFTIGRVGAECEIYPPDGEWAEPSIEHAAALMRHVCENAQDAERLGAQAEKDIGQRLSAQATGAAMRTRLEELSRASGPPAPASRRPSS
jgi:glycosyltransferase involved in cell wall biosynthesis